MSETDHALLKDILDACHKVLAYTTGKEQSDLLRDDELIGFAVSKAIEVIGEAANHLSSDIYVSLPDVEWGDIIGMRNRLIHGYASINYEMV
jgi:uncharacterized protein with HEPN domain